MGEVDALSALIKQLFGNGEQGAFYLPQPVVNGQQVLFQDAAGTIPVTTDGDPVGLMKDLSGSGKDASQPSSASRPIFQNGAFFDGTSSFSPDIRLASVFSGENEFSVWVAMTPDGGGTAYPMILSIRKDSESRNSFDILIAPNNGGIRASVERWVEGSSSSTGASPNSPLGQLGYFHAGRSSSAIFVETLQGSGSNLDSRTMPDLAPPDDFKIANLQLQGTVSAMVILGRTLTESENDLLVDYFIS